MAGGRRRAAVLGMPIAHSLSPVIHNAGYAAAGLADWTYDAHECAEAELAGVVAGLDETWAGLSLTMPLKGVALDVVEVVAPLARTVGAANTLYRQGGSWHADNTDAPGMVDALGWAGVTGAERVAILGAGGTARAAVAAAAQLGAAEVVVHARRQSAIEELRPVAEDSGVRLLARGWDAAAGAATGVSLLITTVPGGVADPLAAELRTSPGMAVFEVLYHPWPTPLAAAAQAAGCTVVGGLDLLLAQAVRQFEVFTGVPAPVPAMRAALRAAAQ